MVLSIDDISASAHRSVEQSPFKNGTWERTCRERSGDAVVDLVKKLGPCYQNLVERSGPFAHCIHIPLRNEKRFDFLATYPPDQAKEIYDTFLRTEVRGQMMESGTFHDYFTMLSYDNARWVAEGPRIPPPLQPGEQFSREFEMLENKRRKIPSMNELESCMITAIGQERSHVEVKREIPFGSSKIKRLLVAPMPFAPELEVVAAVARPLREGFSEGVTIAQTGKMPLPQMIFFCAAPSLPVHYPKDTPIVDQVANYARCAAIFANEIGALAAGN
jgi:hypothetical protein